MAEIDPKLKQAKVAVEKSLLNRPGVTGVDIGYKEVGGQPTDTLAIRVLVKKKRDVPLSERVPQSIEGFPTDVIERKFELHALAMDALKLAPTADMKEYPVLKGGISIGPCRLVERMAYGGTLGVLVADKATGKSMILSNYHVLCVDKAWSDGDPIVQPSRIDGGNCPASQVAILKRGIVGEQVDCAVAELSARQTDAEIIDVGRVANTNKAVIGETVRKRGRTTGLTYGIVDTGELSVNLDFGHGIGQVQLTNQIGIKPDATRNAKFGDNGDSGSLVVNATGEAVGLYFAGDPKDPYGLANPIDAVLTALNVTLLVQSPGQIPAQTPDQIPGQIPGQAPGQTPDQTPGQIPGQAPGQTPDQIPGQIPGQAPGQTPDQTPGQIPGQAPGQTPGQTPGQIPGQAPGQTPGQTPGQIPGQAPGQTPDQGPRQTPGQIPGQIPGQVPGQIPPQPPCQPCCPEEPFLIPYPPLPPSPPFLVPYPPAPPPPPGVQ
jgi:hypothetical protein